MEFTTETERENQLCGGQELIVSMDVVRRGVVVRTAKKD
jgi:hypothetical protein